MMIDSVVWAQYINVADTHTDRHVVIAMAVPSGRQKLEKCCGADVWPRKINDRYLERA